MTIEKEVIVVMAYNKIKLNHFYVVGVYDDMNKVAEAIKIEERNRAGKYGCSFILCNLNKLPELIIDEDI